MKKKNHTPEQIITKLRKVEALTAQGATVAEATRQIGVAEQTVYRWKKHYGQMDHSQAKRLKELQKENARLKKLLAEKDLDAEPGVSERRACKVLGQSRSTQGYASKKPEKDRTRTKRMHQLAEDNPRAGYRMITGLLRREGWRINRKRVHRLWKRSGLQVPKKQRKRRRLGTSGNGCVRLKAQYPGHVWSVDFLFDTTEDGRQLKFMPVLDEYTRECLVIDVSRSVTSERVIRELTRLFQEHSPPGNLRSDNGPEFIAEALKHFLADQEVETRYIEPGAPWQNGYVESFNATFRDELLDRELFSTLLEAKVLSEQYRRRYNQYRPHSSLDYLTSAEYAAATQKQPVEIWTTPSELPTSPQFDNGNEIKDGHQEPVPALT
ncbi:IS3 family transposase [Rhodocaloribacter litoris]|uniref:IS3 family transposase n=1 Tax=Rhodocaloribacter litoris TaxID=2558931 RepID=UPI003C6E9EA0